VLFIVISLFCPTRATFSKQITISALGKQVHREWSNAEKKCILDHLGYLVRQGKVPNKQESEECILKGKGVLEKRDWKTVKYWVKNQISKRNKLKR
jgi:hypothetical protein